MVIMIEGPDRVGKSTQISAIKNYFNDLHFITLSSGFVKQETSEDYIAYSKQMMTLQYETFANTDYIGGHVICDRAHIGETVYSPIYRGYSGDFVYEWEEKYSDIPNQFLILFVDEPKNLISREDGLSFSTDIAKKEEEISRFIDGVNKSKIPNKLIININGKDQQTVSNEVIQYINERLKDANE